MSDDKIAVLLIDDDPDDVIFISQEFANPDYARFALLCAGELKTGFNLLENAHVDVLLLDLNLPDSIGIHTLMSILKKFPALPVIVLTGKDDETSALELVHNGAQDYLVKDAGIKNLLTRSIRYAIERQRLLIELDETRQRERETRELALFEQFSKASNTQITAGIYGQLALRNSAAGFFNESVQIYISMLDAALEQYAFRVENTVSPGLRQLAEKLCLYKASARDVVEIHTEAMRLTAQTANSTRRQSYLDQGRFVLVELMGHLLMCYRNYYSGAFTGRKNKEK